MERESQNNFCFVFNSFSALYTVCVCAQEQMGFSLGFISIEWLKSDLPDSSEQWLGSPGGSVIHQDQISA